jgi:hypothetical protein
MPLPEVHNSDVIFLVVQYAWHFFTVVCDEQLISAAEPVEIFL